MIKTLYTYGVTCLLAILLFACQQESLTEATKGSFSVSLADEALLAATKAQQSISDETAKQFHLCIRNEAGYTLYDDAWTNQPIPAPEGSYTLEASMGKNADVAFDSPYYTGEAKATIQPKQAASVTIPCKVANALVSINWENKEALDQVFINYGVKVVVNQASAQLTPSEPNRKAYLKAGEAVAFYFVGTLRSTGEEKTAQMTSEQLPQKLDAAQHLILTLKTDDRLAMQIEKAEIKTETINATIPLEWLPKPKVTGFANQATSLTYTETADAIDARLAFTASHAIQDLEFTLTFGDEQLQSLNKTYQLSNLTDAEKQSLSQAGITLNTQGTEGNIDLTQLTASLRTNKGEAVDNRIQLRVKANDRWSSEADAVPVYTIQTVKPEFSVSVYPKNIWTKEFTVNEIVSDDIHSGNANKILSDLSYQYSSDGISWETISDRYKSQLTPGSTCFTRALYRNAVPSTIKEFSLYQAAAIPYGDMEDWSESTKKLNKGSNLFSNIDVTAYSPANNVWACVNEKTFEGSPNVSSTYNLNPSTYRVAGVTGYAAALRTVGWDNGAGNTSTLTYHIAAGKLFLGSYSYDHSSNKDNYDYGIESASRPTRLQFQYKYTPYNKDSFKAWIRLENRSLINGEIVSSTLGTGEIVNGDQKDSFTTGEISIDYSPYENAENLPITHIVVAFSSSANCSDIEKTETDNLKGYVVSGLNKAKDGSVLTIDDIQLIYDK